MFENNTLIFILNSLAVWRLTHLSTEEDGPFDIFYKLRKWAGTGFFGKLLTCFYCCSIWVAAILTLFIEGTFWQKIVFWLAISGAACLFEKATDKKNLPPKRAEYFED